MGAPSTSTELLSLLRQSDVIDQPALEAYIKDLSAAGRLPTEPGALAALLVRHGLLTLFQAGRFLIGRTRGLHIGRYKILERLGTGGTGNVYLCLDPDAPRGVAVKIVPPHKADQPAVLARFYREARVVAALDHPNLIRAENVDHVGADHFLVMEYVFGTHLGTIVKKFGPMDVARACDYIRQAAQGLDHMHRAGLVHRDIKPANLLVSRKGVVKILDLGLARFFDDEEDVITRKHDNRAVLGTADYLSPEQGRDSHDVDIRTDIYSLGATFYFVLTGRPPFAEGTLAQKLILHQTKEPVSVRQLRLEIPEALAAVLRKLMAKRPAERYQTPAAVVEALAPWTRSPVPTPPSREMPQLSRAAKDIVYGRSTSAAKPLAGVGSASSSDTGVLSSVDFSIPLPSEPSSSGSVVVEPAAGSVRTLPEAPAAPAADADTAICNRPGKATVECPRPVLAKPAPAPARAVPKRSVAKVAKVAKPPDRVVRVRPAVRPDVRGPWAGKRWLVWVGLGCAALLLAGLLIAGVCWTLGRGHGSSTGTGGLSPQPLVHASG